MTKLLLFLLVFAQLSSPSHKESALDLLNRVVNGPSASAAEQTLLARAKSDKKVATVVDHNLPHLLSSSQHLETTWLLANLAGDLRLESSIKPLCALLAKPNKKLSTDFYMAEELKDDPIAAALAEIGQPSVPMVSDLLGSVDPITRSRAVRVLAKINTHDSLEALRKAREHETDPMVAPLIDGILKQRTGGPII